MARRCLRAGRGFDEGGDRSLCTLLLVPTGVKLARRRTPRDCVCAASSRDRTGRRAELEEEDEEEEGTTRARGVDVLEDARGVVLLLEIVAGEGTTRARGVLLDDATDT